MLLGILLSERGEAIGKTGMEKEEKKKGFTLVPFLDFVSFAADFVYACSASHSASYGPVLVCVALAVLVVNRKVFLSVITFFCSPFFVFSSLSEI